MIQYDPHRWLDHLFDVKGSLIPEITLRVLSCVVWSIAVVAYHRFVGHADIPPTVHTLVGIALGMLLVFRTNSSYNRFWEGRQMWGSLVNETRNLARMVAVHLRNDSALKDPVIRWIGAFPYSVKNVLRETSGLGPIADELPTAEVEIIEKSEHPPLAIAKRITSLLVDARDKGLISDITLASFDRIVQLLIDYVGGCERIASTPLPFAYMVHLRRLMIIYCFTLPFALVDAFGWFTVLAILGVAYTFFGIEEIGVEIENPFGHDLNDLALEELCSKIAKNVLAISGHRREAEEHVVETGEVIKIGVE
jgi:ion channel-forming bestrophin family protein